MTNVKRRLTTYVAMAAMGAAVFTGGLSLQSPSAHAAVQPSVSVVTEVPNVLVDNDQNGSSSIKVVKYKQTPANGSDEGTGQANPPADGETLDGVTFKLEKVTSINGQDISSLDWSKNESWTTLSGLIDSNTGQPLGETVVTNVGEKVTSNGGAADFTDLSFGVYKITETDAPAGVTPITPFYMTLPFSLKVNPSTWDYHPTVYPKNTIDSLVKKVIDSDTRGIGSPLSFEIEGSLSKPNGLATTRYQITDHLDPKLAFQNASVRFKNSSITLEDGDYTITPSEASGDGGQTVVLNINESGFPKLLQAYEADPSDKLVLTINTKIVQVEGEDNVIVPNTAYLIPNDSDHWTDNNGEGTPPGIPSNPVESRFGRLVIDKVAQGSTETKLAHAKFKIFKTLDDAKSLANPITFATVDDQVVSEIETDENGQAIIDGLRLSNFENGVDNEDLDKYYLVETQAPDGYAPLAEPIEINLTDANSRVTTQQIENVVTNSRLKVAKTGSANSLILSLGGVALISAAAGAYFYNRRRKTTQSEKVQ